MLVATLVRAELEAEARTKLAGLESSDGTLYAAKSGWYRAMAVAQRLEIEALQSRIKQLEQERDELRANGGMYLEEVDEMLVAMAQLEGEE